MALVRLSRLLRVAAILLIALPLAVGTATQLTGTQVQTGSIVADSGFITSMTVNGTSTLAAVTGTTASWSQYASAPTAYTNVTSNGTSTFSALTGANGALTQYVSAPTAYVNVTSNGTSTFVGVSGSSAAWSLYESAPTTYSNVTSNGTSAFSILTGSNGAFTQYVSAPTAYENVTSNGTSAFSILTGSNGAFTQYVSAPTAYANVTANGTSTLAGTTFTGGVTVQAGNVVTLGKSVVFPPENSNGSCTSAGNGTEVMASGGGNRDIMYVCAHDENGNPVWMRIVNKAWSFNMSATGSGCASGAQSCIAFTFGVNEPDTNYKVACEPYWNATGTWISAKATTGFTVNAALAPASATEVDCIIDR